MKRELLIPPQGGIAFELKKNEKLKVIDTEGGQVADLLAFSLKDHSERLSTGVTIDNNSSINIKVGDYLYSNKYNRMLRLLEDKVGAHDLLHPPCSPEMYSLQYEITECQVSCYTNFVNVLKDYGIDESFIVTPFNIFMNTIVYEDGQVEVEEPLSEPGDYIVLEAEMDLIVAVTACSVEASACNSFKCTAISIEIF
jgi:uncharacterized protein